MLMSITEMNMLSKKRFCAELNIDDFRIDFFGTNVDPKEYEILEEYSWTIFRSKNETSRVINPPIFYWKKDDIWYHIVVPIEKKNNSWNEFFCGGNYETVDYDKMENYVKKIIEEHSKCILKNNINWGTKKIKSIVDYRTIKPRFLVCKYCGNNVEQGFDKYYSCPTCQSLTTNVEWTTQEIV